jgi:5'-deoxynucleotidase YfbR-like HD superfamily hydrolase
VAELPEGWRSWWAPHILTITVDGEGQWSPSITCPGLELGWCETYVACRLQGCDDDFAAREYENGIGHGVEHRYMEWFDQMGTPTGECFLTGHEALREAVEYLLEGVIVPGSWLFSSAGDGGPGGLGLMTLDYEPDRRTMHPRPVIAPAGEPHRQHPPVDRSAGAGVLQAEELLWRMCRGCGCTEDAACVMDDQPCHWVAVDLCSACQPDRVMPVQAGWAAGGRGEDFNDGRGRISQDPRLDAVAALAQLALRFGRVTRATRHEDGVRAETDTDHTVMLGLIACTLAEKLRPDLDRGRIAAYALVHDLPEALAGDTNTLGASSEQLAAKAQREGQALEEIEARFAGQLPWIARTITAYEDRQDAEARWVKTVDKLVPKLTHLLNGGAAFAEQGLSAGQVQNAWVLQRQLMEETYSEDFPELLDLTAAAVDQATAAYGTTYHAVES